MEAGGAPTVEVRRARESETWSLGYAFSPCLSPSQQRRYFRVEGGWALVSFHFAAFAKRKKRRVGGGEGFRLLGARLSAILREQS